jgi:hypothetical protein
MADHTTRPIGEIKEGDMVLTLDPKTGSPVARRVIRRQVTTAHDLVIAHLSNGEMIETTPRQRLVGSTGESIRARDLSPGVVLKTHDNQLVRVIRIEHQTGPTQVHTLHVQGGEDYFVGSAGVQGKVGKD